MERKHSNLEMGLSMIMAYFLLEPTSAYTHHAGHKFQEVFQMKHGGGYSKLPASKISTDKASYQWISGHLTPAVTSGGVNRPVMASCL
ncbi:hypothetical protein Tco_1294411 [Tanacetum coccineum]